MDLKRKIYDKLIEWKENSQGRTAVLIEGARRVGKSYAAVKFGKEAYKSCLIIDFAAAGRDVINLFENEFSDLDLFFNKLSFLFGVKLYTRESLIIF